ncbi:MAG: sulfatase [bacterium]|nr:sulfatase [bacterium]
MNESEKQMNVLFIICDDLNDWILHPLDHPQVKTPHIDRLRKKSVNFVTAHAAVPVCGPSRKCLFSGLYPQTIDSYGFEPWGTVPLLKECVALPLHFRNNGYGVYGAGKLLHEGPGGDFYTAYGYGVDYGPHPWLGEGPAQFTPHPRQYDLWEGYLPQWDMHRDLNFGPLSDVPEWKPGGIGGKPGAKGWYYRDATPFRYMDDSNRDRLPDEISVDWAVEILKQVHDRPFFIGVGLTKPHTPLYVPEKYFDMFPLEDVALPPYLENDLDDCAPALRNRWAWGFQKFRALIDSGGIEAWRAFVQAYLATLAFVDDQIGKLLDTLDASPYGDNTIVVLTSDNGYHVGEKDCIQKWHLWDESTRIPLLVHVPGCSGNGQTCAHPVSHVDLYPTLVDLCGLPSQPHKGNELALDGHSLRPLLSDPNASDEVGPSVALMAIRDGQEPPHFSVCSRQYRYTLCANGEEELYDHDVDPHEWTNLAGSETHVDIRKVLREKLMAMLCESKVPEGYNP